MIERDSRDTTSSLFSCVSSFSYSHFFSSIGSASIAEFNFPKAAGSETGAPIGFLVDFRDQSDLFDVD